MNCGDVGQGETGVRDIWTEAQDDMDRIYKSLTAEYAPKWGAALKQWEIFRKLTNSEGDNINSLVVFWSGYSAMYITNTDEVCAIGNNGVHLNLLGLTGKHYRKDSIDRPIEIKGLSNKGIQVISLGVYVGAALDREGWLYWWGCCCQNYGEIRTPHLASENPSFKVVTCGSMFIAALGKDGWVYVWGRLWNTEKYLIEYPLLTDCSVISLSSGIGHLAMVTKDGQAFTWGEGFEGQRGYSSYCSPAHDYILKKPEMADRCSRITCGGHSTMFLTDSGHVLACGANNSRYGYLGVNYVNQNIDRPMKVLLPETVTQVVAGWVNTLLTTYAALSITGNVYIWGSTELPQLISSSTSLVGPFLSQSTPRDMMVYVRQPQLVPSTTQNPVLINTNPEADEPKNNPVNNSANYSNFTFNHYYFV